jgi:hypothetical protein
VIKCDVVVVLDNVSGHTIYVHDEMPPFVKLRPSEADCAEMPFHLIVDIKSEGVGSAYTAKLAVLLIIILQASWFIELACAPP